MNATLSLYHIHKNADKNNANMLFELYQNCFGDTIWQASDFETRLEAPNSDTIIVQNADNKPLGFLCYQYISPPLPEAEIILIGADKTARRQGIASMLLGALDKANQWQTIFLDVAEDNHVALKFYHKHGYIIYHRRKGYYQQGRDTAIDSLLMKKSLK